MSGAKGSELLLLMVIQSPAIGPRQDRSGSRKSFKAQGRQLLAEMGRRAFPVAAWSSHPQKKDEKNLARFLISKRVNIGRPAIEPARVKRPMPDLVGMSLRKGLQRLAGMPLRVIIRGSGRIVDQSPRSGTLVAGPGTCLLTLSNEPDKVHAVH